MRHKGISKEETKQKIRSSISKGFRKNGYAGIGVDALTKNANVTSGAFYSHIGSKQKAFEIAVIDGLDEVLDTIPNIKEKHGDNWLNHFIDFYLSPNHATDLECGCAMASITSEVIRHTQMHEIYSEKMEKIAGLIANGLENKNRSNAVERAYGLIALLTGGLNLTRAMGNNNKTLSLLNQQAKTYISS